MFLYAGHDRESRSISAATRCATAPAVVARRPAILCALDHARAPACLRWSPVIAKAIDARVRASADASAASSVQARSAASRTAPPASCPCGFRALSRQLPGRVGHRSALTPQDRRCARDCVRNPRHPRTESGTESGTPTILRKFPTDHRDIRPMPRQPV